MIAKSLTLAMGLALVGCAGWTPDPERVARDVKIACHVWADAKIAAVIAGIFVPGVSSAAVIIGDFVDPVCDGRAVAALTDPATVEWVKENAAKLHAMVHVHG